MKIHGKILHHYLFCRAPADREGYLYKKGEVNTSYQKRWFTLRGNLLFYRDRPGERLVLGVIVLEGCVVQLCESDEQFAFSLAFGSGGGLRTYKFSAENQANQEAWVKAIHSAQHCFLSLLLQDLHQQYLGKASQPASTSSFSRALRSDYLALQVVMAIQSCLPGFSSVLTFLLLEAAKTAGVDAVDSLLVPARGMSHSAKPCSSSVFYTPPTATGQGAPSNRQMIQDLSLNNRPIGKRSPMLWPKRHTHIPAMEGKAPPTGEWSEPLEDFCKMHENFGKEVRQLMAEWKKREKSKILASPERDLIDLG